MAWRFRKSIKLAPGIRMNFSGSGHSWTLGPRGASIGIGRRGTFLNTGIPGSGFSSRQRIGAASSSNRNRDTPAPTFTKMSVSVEIHEDGTVHFKDPDGNPLPEHLIEAAKKQQGDAVRGFLQNKCGEINAELEALGRIHLHTPPPHARLMYEVKAFAEPRPFEPTLVPPGLMGRLFKSKRAEVELANQLNQTKFQEDSRRWQDTKEAFEHTEQKRKDLIEQKVLTDIEAMETVLEENLQDITWPRETLVSSEIVEAGRTLFIDTDLPEIEDFPRRTASVPQRGYKLSIKELSATQLQKLYMQHVHGIGFRIIGEALAVLPAAQQIVFSGYSQRPDRSTGQVLDEYLYSVRVPRTTWAEIDFSNLEHIDVVDAFKRFELKREMTKTGRFTPIEPFRPQI